MTEPWSASRRDTVLFLHGDIDVVDGAAVAQRVVAAVRDGVDTLDLTGVKFCGPPGVRAVLHGHAARLPGTDLHVRCAGFVLQVLEICGLDDVDGLRLVDMSTTGHRAESHDAG